MKQEKIPEKETTQPGSNSQLPLYPRSVLDVDMITSSIITTVLNQNTKPKPAIFCQHFEYSTSFYYFHGSIYIFCLHRKNSKNTTIQLLDIKKDINKIINRTTSSHVRANELSQFEILRGGACRKHAILITPY